MKKPIPCDECRYQRRLCTYDKPCTRCFKYNITCTYTSIITPFDEEYIQKLHLLKQMEQLRIQLCSIEQEMATLQLATVGDRNSFPPLSTTSSESGMIKHQSISTSTDTENNSWSMTFSKGNLVIRTYIKTHAELMTYLLNNAANYCIPHSLGDFVSSSNAISPNVLQMFMWKRYRLTRYKQITLGPSRTTAASTPICTVTVKDIGLIQTEVVSIMTWKLLQAYLYCRHLQHLAIHVPTFLNLLVRPNVMQSSAVLALCAIACATPCNHMSNLIPQMHSSVYGQFYFNQARNLVMENFDDTNLEIYATYVLMAFYQLLIHNTESSHHYAKLAERVGVILTEQDPRLDDQNLFRRLKLQLIKISSPGYMTKYRPIEIATANPDPPFLNDYRTKTHLLQPAQDDSEREKRYLLLSIYITDLHKECHQVVYNGPSHAVVDYLSILGRMIEVTLQQWYRGLPSSFRLDTSILDAFIGSKRISDRNGIWLQQMTQATDAIPLLTTMTLCNEYMMMAKTHLCETPDDLEARQGVASYWRTTRGRIDPEVIRMRWGKRWMEQLTKLKGFMDQLPPQSDTNGNPVEVMAVLLESSYTGFDHVVTRTSVTVAIHAVELLQYLAQYYPCQYDQRVTLNAWDILLRATRFGFGDRDMVQVNLLCCLALVRADCKLLPASAATVDNMEQDYDQCFSV